MNRWYDFVSKAAGRMVRFAWVLCALTLWQIQPAAAHGGKGHDENAFTPLKALHAGLALFDRLIAEGRVDESWETGFDGATVTVRDSGGKREVVVRFTRSTGDPGAVYFFFTADGVYSGSNFTGQ